MEHIFTCCNNKSQELRKTKYQDNDLKQSSADKISLDVFNLFNTPLLCQLFWYNIMCPIVRDCKEIQKYYFFLTYIFITES